MGNRNGGESIVVIASNGGGDRARFVTVGAYDLLMEAGLWPEVDGLSTVSGSGAAAIAALHVDEGRFGPGYTASAEVVPDNWRSETPLMFANSPGKQKSRTLKRVVPEAARDWAAKPYDYTRNAFSPVWIPNASTAQTGERVPLTPVTVRALDGSVLTPAELLYLSSAVPGVLPPGKVLLRSGGCWGASGNSAHNDLEERWLVDGAWADRWGVLTALEFALSTGGTKSANPTRTVVVVDSRPSPISNSRDFAFGSEKPIKVRAQLVGYSIEQARTGTDARSGELMFGRAQCTQANEPNHLPVLGETTTGGCDLAGVVEVEAILKKEGFDYSPLAIGASGEVSDDFGKARLERVGADTLLQPDLWDQPKQTHQCMRTAARLYSVIGTQPTDFSLRPPMLRQGWREQDEYVEGGGSEVSIAFYPYGYCKKGDKNADCERDERAAALAMAGAFATWLRLDSIRSAIGSSSTPSQLSPPDGGTARVDAEALWTVWEKLDEDMNWRSWQAYTDFALCAQFAGLPPSVVEGHLSRALTAEKGAKAVSDPMLDSHTIRLPATYPSSDDAGSQTFVPPDLPWYGTKPVGVAIPPIIRIKAGEGGDRPGGESLEDCIDPGKDQATLISELATDNKKVNRPASVQTDAKPARNVTSCAWP